MAITFLQSEVLDPYKVYEKMLSANPIYWDNENRLWAIYSHEYCKAVLGNDNAHIPLVNKAGLNKYAISITDNLARLSNGVQHETARQTAMLLFSKMRSISINDLFENLLKPDTPDTEKMEIDWVNSICKKLPLSTVLKSFDFNEAEGGLILSKIEDLLKIMLTIKTNEQILSVNAASKEIYIVTEKHLVEKGLLKKEIQTLSDKYAINELEILACAVSNLIGLFIQSYYATRGLLSNSLLQVLKLNSDNNKINTDQNYLEKVIVETLRFDPPIHNTRRVAVENIVLNDIVIKKGETVFLVLASANRDPQKFANPDAFDIERPNNNENLTFGLGGHSCVAKYFSISLAAKCLTYLFETYKDVKLVKDQIMYEPMVNARLPKEILISKMLCY